jgi:hypothetical protein
MAPHPVQVSAGRPGAAGPARTSTHPVGRAHQAQCPAPKTAGPAQAAGSAPWARPVRAVAGEAAGRPSASPAVRKESR